MAERISRRTVLRGLGAAVALPMLDCMAPVRGARAAEAASRPLRTAFLYVPNGVHIPDWKPEQVGADFKLPWILEPLANVRDQLSVLSGLTLDAARDHGDGGGDHARSLASFLTTRHPLKTNGGNIRAGVSVDQLAAMKVGGATRFPSLELGCERGRHSGSCDTGYSCAYSTNMSWRTETMPMAKEVNPRLAFDRLFASAATDESSEKLARRNLYRQSVLDLVLEDGNRLRARIGRQDQRKLDQYLNGIRELELRLAKPETSASVTDVAGFKKPDGIPQDYEMHIRLMCDLIALAFQTDLTRIATFVIADEGSNRSYKHIGVPEGHHDLSHHGDDAKKQEKIRQINRFHITQLAYLLEKLRGTSDGEADLLDDTMLVYGSGIGDGNAHNHDNLPVLLAGGAGGRHRGGQHLQFDKETPLANLYMSMLDCLDVPVDKFGDSTGRLAGVLEG